MRILPQFVGEGSRLARELVLKLGNEGREILSPFREDGTFDSVAYCRPIGLEETSIGISLSLLLR